MKIEEESAFCFYYPDHHQARFQNYQNYQNFQMMNQYLFPPIHFTANSEAAFLLLHLLSSSFEVQKVSYHFLVWEAIEVQILSRSNQYSLLFDLKFTSPFLRVS